LVFRVLKKVVRDLKKGAISLKNKMVCDDCKEAARLAV
jgi:hypothetical protein